jgi:pimeloyl-ACP methyl ester carboxylesterase
MVQLAGVASAERPDIYSDTSPAELLPAGVRTVLIHGEFDDIAPLRVGQDYARRAQAAGDAAEVVMLPGASHYDEVAASSPAWAIVSAHIRQALTSVVAAQAGTHAE